MKRLSRKGTAFGSRNRKTLLPDALYKEPMGFPVNNMMFPYSWKVLGSIGKATFWTKWNSSPQYLINSFGNQLFWRHHCKMVPRSIDNIWFPSRIRTLRCLPIPGKECQSLAEQHCGRSDVRVQNTIICNLSGRNHIDIISANGPQRYRKLLVPSQTLCRWLIPG